MSYATYRPVIPPLFKAIVENDEAREHLASSMSTHEEWGELKRLVAERKDYRRAAEKALQWNAEKGSKA